MWSDKLEQALGDNGIFLNGPVASGILSTLISVGDTKAVELLHWPSISILHKFLTWGQLLFLCSWKTERAATLRTEPPTLTGLLSGSPFL